MTTVTRPAAVIAVEIAAARAAFLAADEASDYQTADVQYDLMNRLLDEYAHIPHQRHG